MLTCIEAGMPAGMEGFKIAEKVLNEWKAEKGIRGPATGVATHEAGEDGRNLDIGVGERMNLQSM